jgi:hypothetical protein
MELCQYVTADGLAAHSGSTSYGITTFLQRACGHLCVQPLVVEEHVDVEVLVLLAPDQVVGELAETAQVVAGDLAVLSEERERHRGDL